MMHHMFIVTIGLAFLVLMAGLFLLAYSKKEQLGIFTKISSYLAITFGLALIIGSLICMFTCGNCEKDNCHGQNKCEMVNSSSCTTKCNTNISIETEDINCTGNPETCKLENCNSKEECEKNPKCKAHCEKIKAEGKEDCCANKEMIVKKEIKVIK